MDAAGVDVGGGGRRDSIEVMRDSIEVKRVSMSPMLLSSLVIMAARPSMVGGGSGGSDLSSPGIADTRLIGIGSLPRRGRRL